MEDHELPIIDIADAPEYIRPLGFFPHEIINSIVTDLRTAIYVPNERQTKSNIHNRATIFADIFTTKLRMIGTNRLFLWNGACFTQDCESRLMNLIETVHKDLEIDYSVSKGEEIMTILLNRSDIHDADGRILNNYPDFIPFQNLYYTISDHSTSACDYRKYFTYAFNVQFNPTATCPQFLRFLEQIIPNPTYRRKMVLFLAYCMTSSLKLQKAVVCYGEGSNGKSTLFDLLKELWGSLYTNVAMQEINEKYMMIEFRGKLLNIGPDLPETRIEEEGKIKEAITENSLSSDEKYHDRTKFHNTTKHIYGCNEIPLPPLKAGMAFFRRWILIPFTQTFKSPNDPDFDPAIHKPKDIDLLGKLVSEREGIMAYLISLLPFINELDITDWRLTRAEWYCHSESTIQYYMECEQGNGVQCEGNEMYEDYKLWCSHKSVKVTSRKHFENILAQQGYSKERISTNFGEFQWVYKGIGKPNPNAPNNPFER